MKIVFLLLGLVCFSFANVLTWESLIENIDKEPAMQAAAKKQSAIQSTSNTKLWNSLEFQYKLNGFGFMEHGFELKLKPKDFGEGSSTKNYWNAQKKYQQVQANFEKSYLVYDRFERALRYFIRSKIQNIHKEMLSVNKDRLEVLHVKSGNETFNFNDLVAALETDAALEAELIADSNALQDIVLKLKSWVDFDSIALDSSYLPTIEKIETFLKQTKFSEDSYLAIAMAKEKWNVYKQKFEQEQVGSNRIITSIGLGYKLSFGSYEYDSVKTGNYTYDYKNQVAVAEKEWKIIKKPDDVRTRDKFYASISLRLPFFGTDGGDETKRQIDVLEAESDYLDDKRDLLQKVARLKEETFALIAQRNIQKKFQEKVNAGGLFEEFAERSGSDPLLLLRARDVSLEAELKAVKLEYEIYYRFFILLDYVGFFASDKIFF